MPVSSVADLANAKMYGYMLPTAEIERRNWTIEVGPFQLNCSLRGENVWDPLYITYYTDEGDVILNIRISDGDPFVDNVTPDAVVTSNFDYAETGAVEYRQRSDGSPQLYFIDIFDLEVVVESPNLAVEEVVELTSSLEYVGAEPDNVIIPWKDGCS
jgi:hypothetical protein